MICCVLLASGFGRRFGSNKLLYEVGGKPMAAHALELVKELSTRTAAGHEIREKRLNVFKRTIKNSHPE